MAKKIKEKTKEEVKVETTNVNAQPVILEEEKKAIPDTARWYVVHTYSGHEDRVAETLKQRIESMHLEEKIFDIFVPTRHQITVKSGQKHEIEEKIFPGYILVQMILSDDSWLAVRTTHGVTSFVGVGNRPTPLPAKEVETIMKFAKTSAPKFKASFTPGEAVKIIDGPFADFLGTVDTIDDTKGKVRVLVSIFGRETPVELDFLQVSKL